jgi:hypothetical protein
MDAAPILGEVGNAIEALHLDVVLIGNAAAALQGAPVTTIDLDFMFRKTPGNLRKLKALATRLQAVVMRPFYPASDWYRLVREEDALQVDFMATVHGIRSYEGLRSRASTIEIGGATLRVASLTDIIKSKRAAGRPRDKAVLEVLERARQEASKPKAPPRRRRARE